MKQTTLRLWSAIHKWTSLICTAFIMMLCLTGLPLIFHDEIDHALDSGDWQPAHPDGPMLSLDAMLNAALANRPGDVPLFMSFDIDRPVVNVTSGPSVDATDGQMHFASFDRTSGALVPGHADGGVMDFILQLHTDLFLGLPGMLFLGAMGLLLVAAIVSGVVLYAPFMRKLKFGTLRQPSQAVRHSSHRRRANRIKWLDYHNLLGIVTVAWLSVVGVTGVINTLANPIVDAWRTQSLADLTAGYRDASVPTPAQMASLDDAVAQAQRAAPDMTLQFVAFPGGGWSTDHHYAIFLHGNTPLTEHIITPALVDARTGEFADMREMPWYNKALALSGPLHFGDYGGLPLKILWAILDVFTIVVLITGLYLWIVRRPVSARNSYATPPAATGRS
ncbi:PepSY-associated TM helix domain-containing protein [Alloalcanivorax mobilis]|uniref:PepSY-associated TM helix domain-containing protein n=1 Tax=Alloalcanivorax mobilis TaxID=2019569 RepID=UPI000B5B207E|nr:PepSY domain-containing protein [Alloalcanivorax mobilis]ASK33064.1 peptidase [Alcanivorax sp. N3-2A]ASK36882.1 peptidase [Alcanivorax sp. N3-2A]|tara:strand:- start:16437 stop:17609 length:1173 start_codon:yes stop_codon:yes gene_type:complete